MLRIYVELCQNQILALLRKYSQLHLWISEYQRRSLPKDFVVHMEEDVSALSEKCFNARKAAIPQSFNAVTTKSNYQHQHVLLWSKAETCSSWFFAEINRQLHTLLSLLPTFDWCKQFSIELKSPMGYIMNTVTYE